MSLGVEDWLFIWAHSVACIAIVSLGQLVSAYMVKRVKPIDLRMSIHFNLSGANIYILSSFILILLKKLRKPNSP